MTGGVLLSLVSIFLASKPLSFGIWYQAEPVVGAIRVTSGIAGIGIFLFALAHRPARGMLVHPFVVVPTLLAIWSILASVFHDIPVQSWHGSVEIGEGVLWYANMAILIAASLLLLRFHRIRRMLLGLAVVSTVVVALSSWMYTHGMANPVAPYFFADYIAFLGFGSGAIVFMLWRVALPLRLAGAILLAAGVIIASSNNAAIGTMVLVMPAAMLAYRFLPVNSGIKPYLAVAAIMLVPLTITLLVTIFDLTELAMGDSAWIGLANSVRSRHYLTQVVWDAMSLSPQSWLVGLGWGSYSDQLAIHMPVEWVALVDDPISRGEMASEEWWDAVHRVDFHSHNFVLESILGAGIPGMLLSIMVFAILPLGSRRKYAALAFALGTAYVTVYATWFLFIGAMPLVALALASMARPFARLRRVPGKIPLIVIGFFGVASLLAGIESIYFSNYAYSFAPPMTTALAPVPGKEDCPVAYVDRGRNGDHLSFRLRTLSNAFQASTLKGEVPDREKVSYMRGIICAAEQRLRQPSGIKLQISAVTTRSDMAFLETTGEARGLVDEYLRGWEQRVDALLARAPKRTDFVAPLLSYYFARQDQARLTRLSNRLFEANPKDPIALWFTGLALLNQEGSGEAGLGRMRRSLELGVERLMPVDPQVKADLTGTEVKLFKPEFRESVLYIDTASGMARFNIDIADTSAARDQGFKWRTSMEDQDGMLLVYESADRHKISMENVFVALDMLFLSVDGRVTEIVRNAKPRSINIIQPEQKSVAILQLKAGTSERLGIQVGAAVRMDARKR
ncbi:DUF192 domain-containing protein [Magnetospira sp. QH-2]|uniref:DUF192 domain-containing protein n=1 Tax=Magnetospira sp. (strain QH-2) TaxID=1288970 RepID=UPI0003E8127B|nr:DUF192 domain-containing protein [Magnetospira sp. QH-2]CCQ75055.1 membrane protein of unknown function [Magnetospira sp. QH-2]